MSNINEVKIGEVGVFNAMVASGPVIIRECNGVKETLLVKHGDKPLDELKWKFCGGKIIRGLSLEENAIREAKEEVGVAVRLIKPLKPMSLWQEVPETGSEKPDVIILIHYLAEIDDESKMGQEVLAMDWFPVDNLPSDSAPNVRPVIEEYLKTL